MGQQTLSGVTQSQTKTNEEFIDKLQKVKEEETANFGRISIYRLTESPYDYIMKFSETAISGDTSLPRKENYYRSIERHKNIVAIEAIVLKETIQICIKKLQLDLYARYYNFTLDDAIKSKIRKKRQFKEGDLLYVFSSLAAVGKHSSQRKQYTGIFRSNVIYLSPEGYIKVYPFQSDRHNFQEKSKSTLNQQNHSFFYPNQVEVNLTSRTSGQQQEFKYKTFRDDVFDTAIVVLQLIFLNNSQEYYNLQENTPKKQQIEFALNKFLESKNISTSLKKLLKNIIQETSQWDFDKVAEAINKIKEQQSIKASYCIKLEDDSSMDDMNSTAKDNSEKEKEERLKKLSAHHNLVPTRIKLTKSKSKQ